MWDVIQAIASWLLTTVAAERITEILIHGEVFFGLRSVIAKWYVGDTSSRPRWLIYKVSTCAWCCSVWISLLCVVALPGRLFGIDACNNIVIKWFALVGTANLWHAIFRLIFRGRVHTYDITVINKHDTQQLADIVEEDEQEDV